MSIKRFFAVLVLILAAPVQAGVDIQHWQTPEGARVFFVESHELPILDISVDFRAGSARDPVDKSGLARLTHALLDQGAGGLSDTEIAHRLADVGAVLGGNFDRDRAGVTLRTLSSMAEKTAALDTLVRVLQQPDFPLAVMQRERRRLISSIREAEADPGTVAEKAFYRALYADHPYARDENGVPGNLEKLTRNDVSAFYRAHYGAPNAVISLIGAISRSEAEAIATRLAEGLPAAASLADLPLPVAATASTVRFAHPSTQSHVLMGAVGVARSDPDYFPLFVGNYALGGGGFDSRLMREVRDKRGFAYSAYSYFLPMLQAGPFQLGLQTKLEQTDEAMEVARSTLQQFIAEGPSEAELVQAKANLTGGFPLRIDSNKKILEYLAVIGFYNLPLDYLETWTDKVNAVDTAAVRQAFARHLDPERLVTVVVGAEGAR
ncbi:insulinase family protein [Thiobacillus denitrificans ATCC 25259]|uniref:Insulinase family protein n=1 Tax=Thiobacillus denitrificans (strain ATCC 25259 / T1) TaxID=292415 RepID=Q3SLS4_THIDA|nr:pitrilysin family protein [Thiobacillus denitrificans]AAZ96331.1 insulinase family protein [Thiobacillus denitrificans ATCC 25259]